MTSLLFWVVCVATGVVSWSMLFQAFRHRHQRNRARLLDDEEHLPPPRPFLRPAFKKAEGRMLDRAAEAVALMVLEQATKELTGPAMQLIADTLAEEERVADLALFLADPHLAVELGFEAPRCEHCGGEILEPPADWDGQAPVEHLVAKVCEELLAGSKAGRRWMWIAGGYWAYRPRGDPALERRRGRWGLPEA